MSLWKQYLISKTQKYSENGKPRQQNSNVNFWLHIIWLHKEIALCIKLEDKHDGTARMVVLSQTISAKIYCVIYMLRECIFVLDDKRNVIYAKENDLI